MSYGSSSQLKSRLEESLNRLESPEKDLPMIMEIVHSAFSDSQRPLPLSEAEIESCYAFFKEKKPGRNKGAWLSNSEMFKTLAQLCLIFCNYERVQAFNTFVRQNRTKYPEAFRRGDEIGVMIPSTINVIAKAHIFPASIKLATRPTISAAAASASKMTLGFTKKEKSGAAAEASSTEIVKVSKEKINSVVSAANQALTALTEAGLTSRDTIYCDLKAILDAVKADAEKIQKQAETYLTTFKKSSAYSKYRARPDISAREKMNGPDEVDVSKDTLESLTSKRDAIGSLIRDSLKDDDATGTLRAWCGSLHRSIGELEQQAKQANKHASKPS